MAEGQTNNEQPPEIATGEKVGDIVLKRGEKKQLHRVPVWSVPDALDPLEKRPFIVTNISKTKVVALDLDEQAAAELQLLGKLTFETNEALEQKRINKGKRAPYALASELNK